MNKYHICIPSLNRHNFIFDKGTVKFLQACGADHIATIYVADENQKMLYTGKAALHGFSHVPIEVGVLGLANCRNFIQRSRPEGKKLIFMDDDLRNLKKKHGKKLVPAENELKQLFDDAYALCRQLKTTVWGTSQTQNAMFMKDGPIWDKPTCLPGYFFGIVNTHAPDLLLSENEPLIDLYCEDWERSIQYYLKQNKTLLKFWHYTAGTKIGKLEGGLDKITVGNEDRLKGFERLAELYPGVLAINHDKNQVRFQKHIYR